MIEGYDPKDPKGWDDIPEPPDMHTFECCFCKKTFFVPIDHYEGQWDHTEAVCPNCSTDDSSVAPRG